MSKREQGILTFYLSRSLYFGFGLSYIVNKADKNSWLAIIIGMIIGGIILYFFTKRDFYSLYKSLAGKILIILLSIFLINSAVIYFSVLTSNFYLINTPPLMIIIPLVLLIIYGVHKGIKSTARLGEILIIISVILGLIIILSVTPMVEWSHFLPFSLQINKEFIEAVLATILRSVVPIILLLCIEKNCDSKSIMIGYSLGCLTIINTFINTFGILGSTLIKLYRYPEYVILNKIAVLNFLEKIENFLALIWFIDILILALISASALKKVIGEKLFIIFMIIFMFLCIQIFINNYENSIILWQITNYILLFLAGLFPFLTKKKRLKSSLHQD